MTIQFVRSVDLLIIHGLVSSVDHSKSILIRFKENRGADSLNPIMVVIDWELTLPGDC
jgi:hypothetical protein